jgi:hypothetical protein
MNRFLKYNIVVCTIVLIQILVLNASGQSLIDITPDFGYQNDQLSVTISGQNTHFGQGTQTTTVWFEQGTNSLMFPSSVSVINSNTVTADIYLSPFYQTGTYDVKVSNTIDGQLTLWNGFTLFPWQNNAEIVSLNPQSAYTSSILNVTISGQNTNFGQGTSTTSVWLDQGSTNILYPSQLSVVDYQTLDVELTIPFDQQPGIYKVNVNNSLDGIMSYTGLDILETINPPILIEVIPNHAYQGNVLDVEISGQNTHFGQGTATTQIWLEQPGAFLFASNPMIQSPISSAIEINVGLSQDTGFYDLRVSNDIDGSLTLAEAFMVLADTSTGIQDLKERIGKVYPNPVSDILYVEFGRDSGGIFELFSAQVQNIYTISSVQGMLEIDVKGLPAGIYFYRVVAGEAGILGKLVKE